MTIFQGGDDEYEGGGSGSNRRSSDINSINSVEEEGTRIDSKNQIDTPHFFSSPLRQVGGGDMILVKSSFLKTGKKKCLNFLKKTSFFFSLQQ